MLYNSRFCLPNNLKAEWQRIMNNTHGLSELFDRMEAKSPFNVPQNSVVVDMDNITFGPNRYTIVSSESDDHFFKVIYYCMLYYIFERQQDEESKKAYQRLLEYILASQIDNTHLPLSITSEEVKVFLVKFLNILASARTTRKVVLEELNNLPQINSIFLELIKNISGFRVLKFEENARMIEKNIFSATGISLDLLSCELFLLGEEFQVQIRHFENSCEFTLLKDSQQNIKKIKQEFLLGQSAYFIEKQEQEDQLRENIECRLSKKKTKASIIKKSTIKSIDWDGEQYPSVEDPPKDQEYCLDNKSILEVEGSKERKNSDIRTNVQSEQKIEKPRALNFHQIIMGQDHAIAATMRSVNMNDKNCGPIKSVDSKKRFHKQSLQTNMQSPFFHSRPSLGLSFSVRCIKSDGFDQIRLKNRANKRVPTFILNRAKAKQQKKDNNPEAKSTPKPAQRQSVKHLKITFTYKK